MIVGGHGEQHASPDTPRRASGSVPLAPKPPPGVNRSLGISAVIDGKPLGEFAKMTIIDLLV